MQDLPELTACLANLEDAAAAAARCVGSEDSGAVGCAESSIMATCTL